MFALPSLERRQIRAYILLKLSPRGCVNDASPPLLWESESSIMHFLENWWWAVHAWRNRFSVTAEPVSEPVCLRGDWFKNVHTYSMRYLKMAVPETIFVIWYDITEPVWLTLLFMSKTTWNDARRSGMKIDVSIGITQQHQCRLGERLSITHRNSSRHSIYLASSSLSIRRRECPENELKCDIYRWRTIDELSGAAAIL